VLGAALQDRDAIRRIGEVLTDVDFSERPQREVYDVLCHLYVSERDVSPAVVIDEMGPDLAGEVGLDASTLETWVMDSPAAQDPSLFNHFLRKLQQLRFTRMMKAALRDVQLADVAGADDQERQFLRDQLEAAQVAFDQLVAVESGRATFKQVDILVSATTEPEPVPWALKGWLAQGDLAVLAGESGLGKSWLLLDLAFALARGSGWLGQILAGDDARPSRVLYVDEEQASRLVHRRIGHWARGRSDLGTGELGRLKMKYFAENGLNLDDETSFRRLMQLVDEFRPHWLLLDSLVRFHGRDENSNSEMSQFFTQRLNPLKNRCGSGIVALHHFGKPPGKDKDASISARLRGASDLKAQLDQLWGLERDGESGSLVLRHEKSRWGIECGSYQVEIDYVNDMTGTLVHSPGRADSAIGVILVALTRGGWDGVLRADLVEVVGAEGMQGAGRLTSHHLRTLHAEGRVKKRSETVGRGMRYWLVECAPADAL